MRSLSALLAAAVALLAACHLAAADSSCYGPVKSATKMKRGKHYKAYTVDPWIVVRPSCLPASRRGTHQSGCMWAWRQASMQVATNTPPSSPPPVLPATGELLSSARAGRGDTLHLWPR